MSLEQCIKQISQLTDHCDRIKEAMTTLTSCMEKQLVTMDHLLAALMEIKAQLPDQVFFSQSLLSMSSKINQLVEDSSELLAKLSYLPVMSGPATSILEAAGANTQEHRRPLPGPILATLERHGARPTDTLTSDIPGYAEAAEAEKKVRTAQTLTGEGVSPLPLVPTEFVRVLTSHLTGPRTAFHELVSAIAVVSRDSHDLQVAMDQFNRELTDGSSAHAAIISITRRCEHFRNCEAPTTQVTSKSQIPKACHGRLRDVPEGPKPLGRGWVYIYLTPEGSLGLKI
uniref:Polymerase cofactor VP35 n=1 Tax=Myotis capaccinii TaxID=109477 RepID=A0A344MNT2_MYOCA|nr:VP35-like protein [Myotis capaccinii]